MSYIIRNSWKIISDIVIENMIRKENGYEKYESDLIREKSFIESIYAKPKGPVIYLHHGDYFECDELISEIIVELNQKGYETNFCCAGHYNEIYPEIYISFQPWIRFPDNNKVEKFAKYDKSVNTIYISLETKDNSIEFYKNLLDKLSILYNFVQDLPVHKYKEENEGIYDFWHNTIFSSVGFNQFKNAVFNYNPETDSYDVDEVFSHFCNMHFMRRLYFSIIDLLKNDGELPKEELEFRWKAILYHLSVYEPIRAEILLAARTKPKNIKAEDYEYDVEPVFYNLSLFYNESFHS